MNFDFHMPDAGGGVILLGWITAWVITLATVLSRRDFDPVTRLTWVVVVIFVPLFGILLYASMAPGREVSRRIDAHNPLAGTPWEDNPSYTSKAVERKITT